VDPLNVLALSERERNRRDRDLRAAELLEDERDGLGALLDGETEPDPDPEDKDPDADAEKIDGWRERAGRRLT
jgi:hypothetical protein